MSSPPTAINISLGSSENQEVAARTRRRSRCRCKLWFSIVQVFASGLGFGSGVGVGFGVSVSAKFGSCPPYFSMTSHKLTPFIENWISDECSFLKKFWEVSSSFLFRCPQWRRRRRRRRRNLSRFAIKSTLHRVSLKRKEHQSTNWRSWSGTFLGSFFKPTRLEELSNELFKLQ